MHLGNLTLSLTPVTVPVLVMFVYANVLLQQSVDRWFAAPVESVLRQGSAVAANRVEPGSIVSMALAMGAIRVS